MVKKIKLLFFMMFCGLSTSLVAGVPEPWQIGFQEAASPTMEKINELHTTVMWIITFIALFVFALLGYVVWRYRASRNPTPSKRSHHVLLEIVWTAIPALILVFIAFPSMKLLYFMDKTEKADMTLKIIGHQWYWTYEYPDEKVGFDSQMILDEDIKPGQIRLLSVDNEIILPVGKNVRLLMTSDDVLHAWAVPALGIKQDTIPGRLRETWVRINREGVFYGQCSELCGKGHGFMPIAVRAVSVEKYQEWLAQAKSKFAL